ncbi:Agamous-like MADS-box protein [Nymphaea thermarum]|nr:Agamous-like MADS-box protein [Nymphaea thermarum]
MGKKRISMERIADKQKRHVTFSKRRNDLFKKAEEVCSLTSATIAIICFREAGNPFTFCHPPPADGHQQFLSILQQYYGSSSGCTIIAAPSQSAPPWTCLMMGKKRISMERIADKQKRHVTFSKRRNDLFKKAEEVCSLSSATIAIICFREAGNPFTFCHPPPADGHQQFLSIMQQYYGSSSGCTIIVAPSQSAPVGRGGGRGGPPEPWPGRRMAGSKGVSCFPEADDGNGGTSKRADLLCLFEEITPPLGEGLSLYMLIIKPGHRAGPGRAGPLTPGPGRLVGLEARARPDNVAGPGTGPGHQKPGPAHLAGRAFVPPCENRHGNWEGGGRAESGEGEGWPAALPQSIGPSPFVGHRHRLQATVHLRLFPVALISIALRSQDALFAWSQDDGKGEREGSGKGEDRRRGKERERGKGEGRRGHGKGKRGKGREAKKVNPN